MPRTSNKMPGPKSALGHKSKGPKQDLKQNLNNIPESILTLRNAK